MPEFGLYSNDCVDSYLDLIKHEFRGKEELLRQGPLVDLGCGDGMFLHRLKDIFGTPRVIGVDRDPHKKYADIEYHQKDFTQTELPDQIAAVVFSLFIDDYSESMYCKKGGFKYRDLFNEVDRILLPGGIYVPLDGNRNRLVAPFERAEYTPLRKYGRQKPVLLGKSEAISHLSDALSISQI